MLNRPDSGEVWFGDIALTKLENVSLPLLLAGPSRKQAERADELLERMGLRSCARLRLSPLW